MVNNYRISDPFLHILQKEQKQPHKTLMVTPQYPDKVYPPHMSVNKRLTLQVPNSLIRLEIFDSIYLLRRETW